MKTKTLFLVGLFSHQLWAFQPVDINQASVEQIALLPSVGEKLAQSIKTHQSKNGRYLSPEDLLKVEGITAKKLAKFSAQLVFGSRVAKKALPKKYAIEPKPVINLRELEQKVLKTQGLAEEIDNDLKKRARRFAWLPELSLMLDMGKNSILTEKRLETRTDYFINRGGGDVGFGIKATFNFEKLIFNTAELEVEKLALSRLKKREEVLHRLHKSYFQYLSLLENQPSSRQEAKDLELELLEIAAQIDAMSDHAFSSYQTELDQNP